MADHEARDEKITILTDKYENCLLAYQKLGYLKNHIIKKARLNFEKDGLTSFISDDVMYALFGDEFWYDDKLKKLKEEDDEQF